jgi:putative transposase
MKRSNIFKVVFKHPKDVMDRAVGSATLWNKLNYRRRQSFFEGEIDWEWKDIYNEFKGWVGSATAQQVIRKNSNAWKGFFALLKKKIKGTLPSNIKKVSPPGYWKDRDSGELKLIYIIRNDNYRIKGRNIYFPFKLKGRIKGKPRWKGKQGELELIYNRKNWIAHQSVETEPISQPSGQTRAYVDMGVRCPITAVIEGKQTPIAYSGNEMLSDWWYWNKKIAEHMSILKKVNNRRTSKRLTELYKTRSKRHKDSVNKLVHHFMKQCIEQGVNDITVGDLKGIRNSGSKGKKVNTMINNFWSHEYIIDRLTTTAENYGITVTLVDERGTSSICPKCGCTSITKRGRLFKCKNCGIEAHRDAVGATNISIAQTGECGNWAMACPEVVNDFCSFLTNNLKGISSF